MLRRGRRQGYRQQHCSGLPHINSSLLLNIDGWPRCQDRTDGDVPNRRKDTNTFDASGTGQRSRPARIERHHEPNRSSLAQLLSPGPFESRGELESFERHADRLLDAPATPASMARNSKGGLNAAPWTTLYPHPLGMGQICSMQNASKRRVGLTRARIILRTMHHDAVRERLAGIRLALTPHIGDCPSPDFL